MGVVGIQFMSRLIKNFVIKYTYTHYTMTEKSIIVLHVQFGHVKFCFNFLEQSADLFSQAGLVSIRQESSINTIEHLQTTLILYISTQ